jgi:hypothetical protein
MHEGFRNAVKKAKDASDIINNIQSNQSEKREPV